MQLSQGARDGQRELSARAESKVRRDRAVDANVRPTRQSMVSQEAARELHRSIGIGPPGAHGLSEGHIETYRDLWRRRADAAKTSTPHTTGIEQTKMKASGRLDGDGFASHLTIA